MKIEQLYTGCLSEAAYYIESAGEAAIIDPLRETHPYIAKAAKAGVNIKYIFETHFHADFVSGHVDLAAKTGATIVYGPNANPNYQVHEASDSEVFTIGNISIKALHTPGHTPESTTYLLIDELGKERAIFTGDTLFIGDVGRPDLAIDNGLTQADLAGMLYDSLHNKILSLPDDVIVYPAHGAGSACGKNISKKTFDTLGNQKRSNYALQTMSKSDFIAQVTDGLLPPPNYFAQNAQLNKMGYQNIDAVMQKGAVARTPDVFEHIVKTQNALIIDTRHQSVFVQGFIPNAIFVGIKGSFAPWVGAVVPSVNQPILIVADEDKVDEVVMRLARVGYDNCLGYLAGGLSAWKAAGKPINTLTSIDALQFAVDYDAKDIEILDVRKHGEYFKQHIPIAKHLPLTYINENIDQIPKNQTYYVHCAGGYRSVIAASILKAQGINNVINVAGGFNAIKKTSLPLSKTTACSAS